MRYVISAMILAAASVPAVAFAAPAAPQPAAPAAHAPAAPAAAAAGKYSVETTDLGTMLDDPAAKAVLAKYLPEMINNAQVEMARPMTLKQLQNYAGDQVTDEVLAKVQADLDKLPAKG